MISFYSCVNVKFFLLSFQEFVCVDFRGSSREKKHSKSHGKSLRKDRSRSKSKDYIPKKEEKEDSVFDATNLDKVPFCYNYRLALVEFSISNCTSCGFELF